MRIALIILHADPARGGAERYTADLAGALAARGHEVSLLASSFSAVPAGVRQVPLECNSISRLGQYEAFLDSLDRHLSQTPYDVVHAMLPVRRCHVYHPHAGIAAEAVATGHEKYSSPFRRAVARLLNRLNRKRRRFAEIERQLLTSSHPPAVVCLSSYIRDAARKHYPLAGDRLPVLLNGVDLARFDPDARPDAGWALRERLGIPLDTVVALMITQDFERKGLRQTIEAAAPQRLGGDVILLVAGRPDPKPYLALARTLGTNVIFAGPTSDPCSFYQAADFFVLPTSHDPCSLVVLESLAMGLPVISTRQNGACEFMTDGREGFILDDPTDVDCLADAMHSMRDPQTRGEMRQACLALRPRLSHEAHLDQLLEIYTQESHCPANGT